MIRFIHFDEWNSEDLVKTFLKHLGNVNANAQLSLKMNKSNEWFTNAWTSHEQVVD